MRAAGEVALRVCLWTRGSLLGIADFAAVFLGAEVHTVESQLFSLPSRLQSFTPE